MNGSERNATVLLIFFASKHEVDFLEPIYVSQWLNNVPTSRIGDVKREEKQPFVAIQRILTFNARF